MFRVPRGCGREASSEGSLAEATPDTDESGSLVPAVPTALGDHRHRAKRRHHHHDQTKQQGVQVAALEVQNVKRAINRYGTLPKGARIGAYLESLRQSGTGASAGDTSAASPPPPPLPVQTADGAGAGARSLSPHSSSHMIRSNSSGGVVVPAPTAAPNSPRPRPARPARPAELEFPPPPLDLPPPPEDDLGVEVRPPPPPPELAVVVDMQPPQMAPSHCVPVLPALPPSVKEMLEWKLVAEIKEHADKKKYKRDEPTPDERLDTCISSGPGPGSISSSYDPVTRLVSELSESLNMEARRKPAAPIDRDAEERKESISPADLKASLRKIPFNDQRKSDTDTKTTDFKSQLKRVEPKKSDTAKDDSSFSIMDIKSKLRKVDGGGPATNGVLKKSERNSPEEKETDSKKEDSSRSDESVETSGGGGEEEEKRRSAGSISSLKKLWEKEPEERCERNSPKASITRREHNDSSPELISRNASNVLRRDEKPVVASKPVGGARVKTALTAVSAVTTGSNSSAAATTPPTPDDESQRQVLATLRDTFNVAANEMRCGGGDVLWRVHGAARGGGARGAGGRVRGTPRRLADDVLPHTRNQHPSPPR